jgi:hypothetical protein
VVLAETKKGSGGPFYIPPTTEFLGPKTPLTVIWEVRASLPVIIARTPRRFIVGISANLAPRTLSI